MARNDKKEYWGADLPKGSDALTELDQFCEDQGMITRSDATRMILIAWAKSRQGKETAVWSAQVMTSGNQPMQSSFEPRRAQPVQRPINNNAAAVELDM
jgi:hypothetical protein